MPSESDKTDGIPVDLAVTAAARALATGDPLTALKWTALRDDPQALALRGIAMAQLGDLARARQLLRRASRAFGSKDPLARARCVVAEAEIALVSRDLRASGRMLEEARVILLKHGDRTNAAHAAYLEARRCLLLGDLKASEQLLGDLEINDLPLPSRTGYELVTAGIAMRRIQAGAARAALESAQRTARIANIAALIIEVDHALLALDAPAARLISRKQERLLALRDIEILFNTKVFVIDACRNVARLRQSALSLAGRPVLFALARALAEGWPEDVSREKLIATAFRIRDADESLRARLRVEIGRLRKVLKPMAELTATKRGFVMNPVAADAVAVLAPRVEDHHVSLLALLADGEAWSSSALAMALGVSSRTAQRTLEVLAAADKIESIGRGRACRWIARNVPGFPSSMSLPSPLQSG